MRAYLEKGRDITLVGEVEAADINDGSPPCAKHRRAAAKCAASARFRPMRAPRVLFSTGWCAARRSSATRSIACQSVHATSALHALERDALHLEAWHPFVITIRRHDRQVAFQRGGGDQRIDIANQTRAIRRPESAADFSIAFQDGVGDEIRVNCAQQPPESNILGGIVL